MKRLVAVFAVLLLLGAASAAIGILLARGGAPAAALGSPTLLVWRIDRPIVEWTPVVGLPFAGAEDPDTMKELYRAFLRARDDESVAGLAVYLQNASFGLAKAQELRRQMQRLSEAGKPVDCYLETAGEGSNGTLAYYLATACDSISLAPGGDLNLLGLYADSTFYSGTLEKLKIEPQYSHVGRFKSAGETFTRRQRGPDTDAAIAAVLDSDFRQIVEAIAETRGLEPARVRELVDGAPWSPEEATAHGLIDHVEYPDQFRDRVEAGIEDEPRLVALSDYRGTSGRGGGDRIAVVYALGTIVRGTGGVQPFTEEVYLGSDELAEMLRALREDDSVDAVVLRVDSPGGSALASDLMLREVELTAAAKPLVVSMSDLAASGGYYIAARASRIVAEPATLTGSIGVVGGKLMTRRFQDEVLGITHDTDQRGANADLYSSLAPFSPEQAVKVRREMERVYRDFVAHVAAGRGLDPAAVEEVAQGRVWTGEDAHARGLVDELGGIDRAVELAKELAGIDGDAPVRLVFYPEQPTLLDLLLERRPPALPSSLARLVQAVERPNPGLLELPPEYAGLASPF